jgi:hypothetical protein
VASYGNSGKTATRLATDFSVSGTVELIITRKKVAEVRKGANDTQLPEPGRNASTLSNSDTVLGADCHNEDTLQLRTHLDSEVAVIRNWTFMGAAAALLTQHNATPAALKTIMFLYCFTSGFAIIHARDCLMIARALNMKCERSTLATAIEFLMHPNDAQEPRDYSASDVYSLVDTTRIALRNSAVDLIVMAARHYLENIMLYPHSVQSACLPVLLQIASRKSSLDSRHLDTADALIIQLQCAIQSWNAFTVQSIRRMQVVLDASGDRMQRLLTVGDELQFQLSEIAPLYPSEILPKQTIARNLCSQVMLYTQAFIIEGSDHDTFDSDLLIQV